MRGGWRGSFFGRFERPCHRPTLSPAAAAAVAVKSSHRRIAPTKEEAIATTIRTTRCSALPPPSHPPPSHPPPPTLTPRTRKNRVRSRTAHCGAKSLCTPFGATHRRDGRPKCRRCLINATFGPRQPRKIASQSGRGWTTTGKPIERVWPITPSKANMPNTQPNCSFEIC